MVHRGEIEIKTKYQTSKACAENCRDLQRKLVAPFGTSKKIYGEVLDDYTFTLSNASKMGTIFKFVGEIESRGDGIYMVGLLSVKPFYKILLWGLAIFLNIIGIMLAWQGVIIYGLLLIVIGWTYLLMMNYSDTLYKNLLKKVR